MTTLPTKGVVIRGLDGFSDDLNVSFPQQTPKRFTIAMAQKFTIRIIFFAVLASLLGLCLPQEHFITTNKASSFPDLYEASIAELQNGLASGLFTSVDLVKV